MKNNINILIFIFLTGLITFSCSENKSKTKSVSSKQKKKAIEIKVPDFNADSAYHFVKKQVEFGPRVPNTPSHQKCAKYLVSKLKSFTPNVEVQNFKARAFNEKILNGKNIIASFKPEAKNRVLLCAHWDSRPFADHDPDKNNHDTPIDGANDGASGVGVLLEIARQLSIDPPPTGIDIIFFDVEDYGEPQDYITDKQDNWALGSQYWSKNPHQAYYTAKYGILLDMVGSYDPTFTLEMTSMYYAPDIMKTVWETAHSIGYRDYFLYEQTGAINDDHLYINEIIKIPTIDIIHYEPNTNSHFFEYWHTVNDNIECIDKETLKIVGQTVLTVIYRGL